MPTFYTHDVLKGISFEQFVKNCSRAFGAVYFMRDEPAGTPIPESIPVDPYHLNRMEQAIQDLKDWQEMSIEDAENEAELEFKRKTEQRKISEEENPLMILSYTEMLRKVRAWDITEPYFNLKEFMIEQLVSSIKHDDSSDFYIRHPIVKLSGKDWIDNQIESAKKEIKYHKECYDKEVEHKKTTNEWIIGLNTHLQEWKDEQHLTEADAPYQVPVSQEAHDAVFNSLAGNAENKP